MAHGTANVTELSEMTHLIRKLKPLRYNEVMISVTYQ